MINLFHYPTPAVGLWRITDWKYSATEQVRWTEQVLEMGAKVFDLADIYGNYAAEACFGKALAIEPSLRKRIFLITKCGMKLVSNQRLDHTVKHYDTSRTHITASVEQSLRNLHTDHIDLLLIHRPDPLMDADEVAEAFVALKQAGKVFHFGVSNFSTSQFDLLSSRLPFSLLTNQIEYSVLCSTPIYDGTLDQCQRLRISPMAWSPLGGGRLFNSHDELSLRVRGALEKVGKELGGLTIDQVAFAWLATHPAKVVPVTGTSKTENIRLAIDACKIKLSRQQWFSILATTHGQDVP